MTATRTLIVDDIPQVREDLRTLLMLTGNIEIVGEAVDGSDAIRQVNTCQPEVVLMDLEMPILDGYEATRQIKTWHSSCCVVALTVHDYPAARAKAAQAGVDVFIVKGASVETLVQAISGKKE
jgi:DNA-binding NarL/FixJ family response regulator